MLRIEHDACWDVGPWPPSRSTRPYSSNNTRRIAVFFELCSADIRPEAIAADVGELMPDQVYSDMYAYAISQKTL